jgi:hypothetical protein
MTALRRTIERISLAAVAALMALPAIPAMAQNSDAPVDVTAAPPPAAGDIGPSQLRDFNLNGTVTRPADGPATAQPTPDPGTAAPSATTPGRTAGPMRTTQSRNSSAAIAPPAPNATPPVTLPDISQATAGSIVAPLPSPDFSEPSEAAPLPTDAGGFSYWPWLVALAALLAGGAYLLRGRRDRRARYADFDRLAFAGPTEGQAELPRPSPKPVPTPKPAGGKAPPAWPTPKAKPEPVPPSKPSAPWPTAAKPAPAPDPAPAPAPTPKRDDGGIVSIRLKPELNVEFVPDRAVVTERDVMLQFDVTIVNSGSAPARDVLVEGRLVSAHAAQDAEIAEFFAVPDGTGDRMALIPPLGRIALKSAVRLPLDQLHSFEVEGRRLFVPLVALNILFRSGGGDGHASASYLVGRGTDEDAKLAPFRLDLGPRIFRGLSARPHSMGLER